MYVWADWVECPEQGGRLGRCPNTLSNICLSLYAYAYLCVCVWLCVYACVCLLTCLYDCLSVNSCPSIILFQCVYGICLLLFLQCFS